MTDYEINNLRREDILSEKLIAQVMDEDEMIRELTIAKIADHARAFGMKIVFLELMSHYKSLEKKQRGAEQSQNRLRERESDNNTVFLIPEDRFDIKNLKCGPWCATENGIFKPGKYSGDQIIASYQPVLPICKYVNIETGTERVKLAFKVNGKWRDIVVDRSVIASNNRIVSLSDYGLSVTSETSKYLVQYLAYVEAVNKDMIPVKTSTSRLGWHDTIFVPYDSSIEFDGNVKFRPILADLRPKGDRDIWYSNAKKIRAMERIEPRIAMAASLASVIVGMVGALPFFTHFYGISEAGKTLLLMLGASIWGNPAIESAYVGNLNGTDVGYEVKADLLNNLPLFMDDTAQVREQVARNGGFSKMIYTLCNGKGRSRSNKNLGLNRQNHWCNTIITTGEEPIVEENAQGGAINRVLEVRCGYNAIFEDGPGIADFLRNNYGFAGMDFVKAIQEIGVANIQPVYKGYVNQLKAYGKMQKQTMALALILTADAMANSLLFDDGRLLPIEEMVKMLKSNEEVSDNVRCLNYILESVSMNINKFISRRDNGELPKNEVWGTVEDETININRSVFDSLCKKGGFSARGFLDWANCNNILITNKNQRTRQLRILGDRIRCVSIIKNAANALISSDSEDS